MRRTLLLIAFAAVACGGNPKPVPAPAPPVAAAATRPGARPDLAVPHRAPCAPSCTAAERLALELDLLFGAPAVQQAIWSIRVQSLETGELLYALNPDTLVMPASNMKIVTLATAAERLGWDYRFETRLETGAPATAGVLHGDLVVVGGGDPSINGQGGPPDEVFAGWAAALRQAGISRIDGHIVGDDDAFDDERYGDEWSWDDFAYGYQAPVGALQVDEGLVDVVIAPGREIGAPAAAALRTDNSGLDVVSRATTGAAGTRADVDIFRFPGSRVLEVRGTIPLGGPEVVREAAVDNPTLFFVRTLRAALIARGIAVAGDAIDGDDLPAAASADLPATAGRSDGPAVVPPPARPAARRVLARHLSAPLSEVARRLMKVSQNLYAETFMRALSLTPGPASAAASQQVQAEILESWGIAPGHYALADGSGLSRHNLVTASTIVRILQAMARTPRHAEAFEATLPIAGADGTIASRMKATRAENNVKAKTGTLRRVRALSGYVTTIDGERVVFAILANHFTAPTRAIDTAVDAALERLANFSRK